MFFEGILQAQVLAVQVAFPAVSDEPQERRDAARSVREVQHFGGREGAGEVVAVHRTVSRIEVTARCYPFLRAGPEHDSAVTCALLNWRKAVVPMAVMDDPKAQFLAHAEHVRSDLLQHNFSEADTRSYLIEPVLAALGYDRFANLRREVRIPDTNESIDFELRVGGKPKALVEAKRVRTTITVKHAAQCVQYAAVHGVRWCVITNGLVWALYDAHLTDFSTEGKRVAEVRIDGDADSTEAAWQVLLMLAHDQAVASRALQSLLIERVVSDQLSSPDSQAIVALRRDIRRRFGESVSGAAIVEFIDSYRSSAGVTVPETAPEPAPHQVPESASSIAEPAVGGPASVESESPATSGRRRTTFRVKLQDLVDAGFLPHDAEIEAQVYGVSHSARLRDGMIEWEGRQFSSPSPASQAVRRVKSWNGWVDWRYRGERLADIRDRFERQAPPDPDPPRA